MNVSLWKKHWQKAVCVFAVLAAFVIAILGTTV